MAARVADAWWVAVYDKLDWHFDSAVAAGQPPENAFTHIGFYLAWLIRHDLHNARFLPPEHVEAVKHGEMTGSDLADDIDELTRGMRTDGEVPPGAPGESPQPAENEDVRARYDVSANDPATASENDEVSTGSTTAGSGDDNTSRSTRTTKED